MKNIRVLVNADDYGHDENRTRAIQKSFEIGAITATTAMANRPWFEAAMREAKQLDIIGDVGLHFNITEGEPLTEEARRCPQLCDETGQFKCQFYGSMKGRLYQPKQVREAIRAEAEAQIRKYLDCGGSLMQLDSHHHVHTFFSVAPELYHVAKKFGFKSARLSRNFGGKLSMGKRLYKVAWNAYSTMRLPSRADYFGSFDDFVQYGEALPDGVVVEVMTHPLYAKEDKLDLSGELLDSKQHLMSDEVDFWKDARTRGIRLCRYSELEGR